MAIVCEREMTITIAGCPVPVPPAFTLPAGESSFYDPIWLTVACDPAPVPGQLLAIPHQTGGTGDGISIIDTSTNPGTLVTTHAWPSAASTFPAGMVYDPDSGLIVALMSRTAGNLAVVFFDPTTGYVSHADTAVVWDGTTSRGAVTRIRGRSSTVLANNNQSYWLVNTQTRTIDFTYNIGANTTKPTYCCEAEVGAVLRGATVQMFNVDTGALNGVALEATAFQPVYVDSVQKIVAFKGTSSHGGTPYRLHVYNPVTGALETSIAAQVPPLGFWGGAGERSSAYNFFLNRLVALVDDNSTDATYLAYYDPADWSFTSVKQGQDFENWNPTTMACDDSDGSVHWRTNNGSYFSTRPIV